MLVEKYILYREDLEVISELTLASRLRMAYVAAKKAATFNSHASVFKDFDHWHRKRIVATPGKDSKISLLHSTHQTWTTHPKSHTPGDTKSPFIQAMKEKGHEIYNKDGEQYAKDTSLRSQIEKKK